MKKSAILALLFSLLTFFAACSPTPQVKPVSTTILSDTLREGLEVPEMIHQSVQLTYYAVGSFTVTNAEGQTLRVDDSRFSGDMEVLDHGFYVPSPFWVEIPASSSFTITLDAPSESESAEIFIYGISPPDDSNFYSGAQGTGFSTIVIDTLGTEIRGEKMDCFICTAQECTALVNINLEATDASHLSIFCKPGSSSAILDTDGIDSCAQVHSFGLANADETHPMVEGIPLKLTNLQSEDITLIQAEPYED